jgi:hypothetical protein
MSRKATAALLGAVLAALLAYTAQAGASSRRDLCASYHPRVPPPSHFAKAIDNEFFPLPPNFTFVFRGVENGKQELDRMHVTLRTRVIDGITATVVSDNVYEPLGKLAEKTLDYYAQDHRGNVWYLGEDTREFKPGGKVDRSGSWLAGRNGAKPGLIMEADPRVPDAYRQECLSGEAEDMAWVVGRGGPTTVPVGTFHHVVRTLEFSTLEPAVVERKTYARRVGVISEQQLSGGHETLKLVRITGSGRL